MSRIRFFDNPYDDHTPEPVDKIISNGTLHKSLPITSKLEEKWQLTLKKLENLDYSDYSVYTGSSGIALLKLLKMPDSKDNLKEIMQLLSLHRLKNRRHSFLCGDAGPLAIGAVIANKLGDGEESKNLIKRLINMQDDAINYKSDLPNEYLYGRAGYLFALLYVNKHINPSPVDESVIRKIIEAIFICGKNEAKAGKFKCPLMYQWHDSYYLGAAHGVSGILYLLLQVKEYLTETELNTLVKPTIDYLTTLRFPSGNYPSSLGSESDKYVQWCHGAPGFVYLFSIAYKVFKDPKYLQLALEAGDVVWKKGILTKGYSICHGVSGNAYCFLELYQQTQDIKHLNRAIKFAEWCLFYSKSREGHPPDRPLSLFEGIAGPMYLLLDIQKPLQAKFPGFTL